MRLELTFILLFAAYTCSTDRARPQSDDLIGHWKVDMTFSNEAHASLRFDAEGGGKGSFLLERESSNWSEPAKPSVAKWSVSDKRVTFSGPLEFPIGNVGREPGTLVFTGKFENGDLISGELMFFPMGQDPADPKATPSRTGKFKATRLRSV